MPARALAVVLSIFAMALLAAAPAHAAEACPVPGDDREALVNGKPAKASTDDAIARRATTARVGDVISVEYPFSTCFGPTEAVTTWADAYLALLKPRKPGDGGRGMLGALGHGVRRVGACGISTPVAKETGFVWPVSVSPVNVGWFHRAVLLRVEREGTYYLEAYYRQGGSVTSAGRVPTPFELTSDLPLLPHSNAVKLTVRRGGRPRRARCPAGPTPTPTPTEPSPPPKTAYPGVPAPSVAAGCAQTVDAGPVAALASCFLVDGEVARSDGRVRVNGIDLTPARSGVKIAIDRRSYAISSDGPVEVRIGPLSVLRDRIDWRGAQTVFAIKGSSAPRDGGSKFVTRRQQLFGLPVDGSAKVELVGGKSLVTVTVGIPKDKFPARLATLAGYSGQLQLAATNDAGLVLDGAKLTLPGTRLGWIEVQRAELAVSRSGSGAYHFDGTALAFPFTANRLGIEGTFGLGPGDGYAKLGLAVEQLNRALVYGVFLQKLGLTLQVNPFGIVGAAAVTLGPQFHLRDALVSALRLDGSLGYLDGTDGKPGAVKLTGALTVGDNVKSADGKVTVQTDGAVDVEGNFDWTLAGYGFTGGLQGWADGLRAFALEGDARLSLPASPDGAGQAVVSTRGLGACRRGLGPDVGFGYEWGRGLDGLFVAASSCDLGRWRQVRGAQQAATAPAVAVARGQRRLAVQVEGADAPPAVAFVAPDGRRVEQPASGDAVLDDRTLLFADPATRSAYLIVDRPTSGRWRIELRAGSTPVAAVRVARELPRLRVTGRVRTGRSQRRRIVSYHARGLAGRQLQLIDVVGRSRRVLGTVARPVARVRFTPLPRAGTHRVEALVLGSAGLPTGRRVVLARFRHGPGPLRAPRGLRVRRRATSAVITWRGPRTLRFEATVRASDGRRLRLLATGARNRMLVPLLPRDVALRVQLVARDPSGRVSRPARRSLRRR